jgi:hypothetical protein
LSHGTRHAQIVNGARTVSFAWIAAPQQRVFNHQVAQPSAEGTGKAPGALEQNCGWLSRVDLAARAISFSITPGSGLGRDGGGISHHKERNYCRTRPPPKAHPAARLWTFGPYAGALPGSGHHAFPVKRLETVFLRPRIFSLPLRISGGR